MMWVLDEEMCGGPQVLMQASYMCTALVRSAPKPCVTDCEAQPICRRAAVAWL